MLIRFKFVKINSLFLENALIGELMNNEKVIKLSSKTIDITPSWRASVEMMLLVLNNPKASKESKQVCHEELLRLADIVDNLEKQS